MHFPKFWARGEHDSARVWRWSDVSVEDAQRQADARAIELAKIFAEQGRRFDKYSYGSRPLREEIVQQSDGVVISRNLYGALVLNAARAMFVDIDFGEESSPALDKQALERAHAWAGRHGVTMRVYRTFAGQRWLVTSASFDPKTSTDMLRDAGSDPLYVKLCVTQESFRARLTPKPWRLGIRPPRDRFPFASQDNEAEFRIWQAAYERKSAGYVACKLLETVGNAPVAADIAPVIEQHDRMGCGDRPLA
jgi:hypothetical protein